MVEKIGSDECCDGTGHREACEGACDGCCPQGHLPPASATEGLPPTSAAEGPPAPARGARKGGRYVEVPARALFERLESAGFARQPSRGEVVYARHHDRDPRLVVLVYTSVPQDGDTGRGCGEDAIRLVALFQWTRKGETELRSKRLYTSRVFRVTSVDGVLERMISKAREAYAACNAWRAANQGAQSHST